MALDSDSLIGVAKTPLESVYLDEGGPLTAIFRSAGGGAYGIGHESTMGHPMFPDYPVSMVSVQRFADVLKALHSTLAEGQIINGRQRPDLSCLHFLPDCVEATDSYRITIIDVVTGVAGKVPASAFKHWGSGDTAVAFTGTHAWFRTGEEMRFQKIQRGTYAEGCDLRNHVPQFHDGPWMTTPAKPLRDVVKKALSVSPVKQVILEFGVWGVTVKAETPDSSFEERVDGEAGVAGGSVTEYPRLLVNGKFLDDALRVVSTPNVRLCYGGAASPLRLESGSYVECIWPKVV
jgi:hypothetical protein